MPVISDDKLREEVRAWLAANGLEEVKGRSGLGRAGGGGADRRAEGGPQGVGPPADRGPLDLFALAGGARRAGRSTRSRTGSCPRSSGGRAIRGRAGAWASRWCRRRSSCGAPTSRRRSSCRRSSTATHRYCQGFSEPGAGSDLAGLQTKGIVDGDELIITGQKVWTSGAQFANMMFCLCRTNPEAPKHKGISYVLVPMKDNGFDIRGLRQMTGGSGFSEVFIDGARAPLTNVIGGLHDGWRVTNTTLGNERRGGGGRHNGFRKQWERVVDEARSNGKIADASVRQDLGVGLHEDRDHPLPVRADGRAGGEGARARARGLRRQDAVVGVRPALR